MVEIEQAGLLLVNPFVNNQELIHRLTLDTQRTI